MYDVLIDTEDLEKIHKYNCAVCLTWKNNINGFYAQMTKYLGISNGKVINESYTLHRFLLDVGKDMMVDHINNDTLDNRKSNLRATNNDENLKNRSGRNINNKSGYRNVCWNKGYKMWAVQLQIEGRNKVLGLFDDVNEAGRYAEKMRRYYYGDFSGKGN